MLNTGPHSALALLRPEGVDVQAQKTAAEQPWLTVWTLVLSYRLLCYSHKLGPLSIIQTIMHLVTTGGPKSQCLSRAKNFRNSQIRKRTLCIWSAGCEYTILIWGVLGYVMALLILKVEFELKLNSPIVFSDQVEYFKKFKKWLCLRYFLSIDIKIIIRDVTVILQLSGLEKKTLKTLSY